MSCDKRPHSKTLSAHWGDNYPALLALLGSVHTGVRGLTLDTESNILAGVCISVRSVIRRQEFRTLLNSNSSTLLTITQQLKIT